MAEVSEGSGQANALEYGGCIILLYSVVLQERREGGGGVHIMTGRIKPGRRQEQTFPNARDRFHQDQDPKCTLRNAYFGFLANHPPPPPPVPLPLSRDRLAPPSARGCSRSHASSAKKVSTAAEKS